MRTALAQIFPATSAQLNTTLPNSVQVASTGVNQTFTSSAFKIEYGLGYAVQTIYNGVVNGTISLLSSNDGVNFDTISGTPTVISNPAAGTTGHFTWNVMQSNYQYVQFGYAASSTITNTTGLIRATIVYKGF